MSGNIDKNLYYLARSIDDVEHRINLIKKIINSPNFNKKELIENLHLAQENLTKSVISYLYGETQNKE